MSRDRTAREESDMRDPDAPLPDPEERTIQPDPLPDSEIPPGPEEEQLPLDGIPVPDEVGDVGGDGSSESDRDPARELENELEADALGTDQLRPEDDVVEYEPPDAPSAASRQGVIPEEEGRTETLDERLAQEQPESDQP
jgi:hypothetical protein